MIINNIGKNSSNKDWLKYIGFKSKQLPPNSKVQIGEGCLFGFGWYKEYLVLEDGSWQFIREHKALSDKEKLDLINDGLKNIFGLNGNKRMA